MDYPPGNNVRTSLVLASGRRQSVRSLMAAGMALLVSLGLSDSGEARKKNGGNNNKDASQERHKNHGHKRQKGERGAAGPTGPTGPAGSGTGGGTGPTGPTGPSGSAGAGELSVELGTPETFDAAGNSITNVSLTCPSGTLAIGASVDISGPFCTLQYSRLFNATIWSIGVFCPSMQPSFANEASAVCVSLVPPP